MDVDRFGPRLLGVAVAAGVAAGLGGAVLVLVLHGVQHLAYGFRTDTFLAGVEQASPLRRVLALTLGGAVVGTGWWWLGRFGAERRRMAGGAQRPVAVAVADPAGGLPVRTTTADAVLQVAAVGVGASLGREGAPRQVGSAIAGWLARRAGLGLDTQRTLLACGAGAGLAAVYDVPLAGAAFTLEVLLVSVRVRHLVPAALTAVIATAVAWPVVGRGPVYALVTPDTTVPLLVGALLLGPVAGLVGLGFVRLTTAGRRPTGWRLAVGVTVVLSLLGGVAVVYPQVLGNGRGAAQLAFDGGTALPLLAVLLVGKPLVTAVCLRGGVRGGLLTPALATGALLGAVAGGWWAALWSPSPAGAFAVIGAAAVLTATTGAPVTAVLLTLELTGVGPGAWLPVLLAVVGADLVRRHVPRRWTGRPEPSVV